MGASGAGKSSLLRVVAGLAHRHRHRDPPSGHDDAVLPQHPCCLWVTLRSQLLYPESRSRGVRRRAVAMAGTREPAHPGAALRGAGCRGGLGQRCCRWASNKGWPLRGPCSRNRAICCRQKPPVCSMPTTRTPLAIVGLSIRPSSVSHHRAVLEIPPAVLEMTGGGQWSLHQAQGLSLAGWGIALILRLCQGFPISLGDNPEPASDERRRSNSALASALALLATSAWHSGLCGAN